MTGEQKRRDRPLGLSLFSINVLDQLVSCFVYDALCLWYGQIKLFGQPFKKHAIQKPAFEHTAVALVENPLVDQFFPIGTAEIICIGTFPQGRTPPIQSAVRNFLFILLLSIGVVKASCTLHPLFNLARTALYGRLTLIHQLFNGSVSPIKDTKSALFDGTLNFLSLS